MPMIEGTIVKIGSSDTLALTLRKPIRRELNIEQGDKMLLDIEYVENKQLKQLIAIKEEHRED